jgi:hypothetical protein
VPRWGAGELELSILAGTRIRPDDRAIPRMQTGAEPGGQRSALLRGRAGLMPQYAARVGPAPCLPFRTFELRRTSKYM